MIYEFKIEEKSTTTIPVRADNPDKAQKIFNEWYEKHENDPTDSTITDLLDNGYDGRSFTRSAGIDETNYPAGAVMLPEESPMPKEQEYILHIRFSDGSEPITRMNCTLQRIGMELSAWGEKYYLYPDPNASNMLTTFATYDVLKCETVRIEHFWIYAVLKDKEETWFEME